jgi:predicted nuclease with TOPRIM domain
MEQIPVESFSFLSRVLDYSLALAVMLFVMGGLIWFFLKQIKSKDETIKNKDLELKEKNIEIQESNLKYEAHLRETYKSMGATNELLKDMIREANNLPETVGNKIKGDISNLQERLQNNMNNMNVDLKAEIGKTPEAVVNKLKGDPLFLELIKGK